MINLFDFFREAKNPCMACGGSGKDKMDYGVCLDCNGEKTQSAERKRKLYQKGELEY